ncbi:MAG: hypothetical protein CMN26_16595 [Salinisphaera sp.]|nr:hypothetical protein [Salinisphaera sp.]|tara:strand:+ start:4792 stop:5610 length:819 start_codon:yes stop_codon:yes gene_type:complete
MKQQGSIISALVLASSTGCAAADTQASGSAGPTAAASQVERKRMLGDPAGLRSTAESYGLAFDATAIGDYSIVLDGGANKRGVAARYLIETGVTLDTEAAFGWHGGTLRAAYLGFHGDNGNLDSGDAQTYSNIDETPFDALYSLWYRQTLFNDRIAIKLGKMDANADFAYVDNGDGFLNSSPGFSPTIQAFPSYPDPATAVNVFFTSESGPYAGVGVYDGATQAGVRTGTHGPDTFFGEPSDLFYVAEAGLRYTLSTRDGRIGLGRVAVSHG